MQGAYAFDPTVKTTIDVESFVRKPTAACYADGKGRPSIDPEVFFRMQLMAYFNGITKDRRLCEQVRGNLAYRWFCRLSLEDDIPEHSSLTRIRRAPGTKPGNQYLHQKRRYGGGFL